MLIFHIYLHHNFYLILSSYVVIFSINRRILLQDIFLFKTFFIILVLFNIVILIFYFNIKLTFLIFD